MHNQILLFRIVSSFIWNDEVDAARSRAARWNPRSLPATGRLPSGNWNSWKLTVLISSQYFCIGAKWLNASVFAAPALLSRTIFATLARFSVVLLSKSVLPLRYWRRRAFQMILIYYGTETEQFKKYFSIATREYVKNKRIQLLSTKRRTESWNAQYSSMGSGTNPSTSMLSTCWMEPDRCPA